MSQFITDNQLFKDNRHSKPSIIKGVLSKISVCDSTSPLLKQQENRRYLKQKISVRLHDQEDKAHIRHNQSLICNYMRLKHKLSVYGRSKSCKIQEYFDNVSRTSVRESIEEAKKISLNNDNAEREVVISKKYNHQLAIKTAVLSEMQQLQSIKKRRKQALNKYFNKSLSCYITQICEKSATKNGPNPVLAISQGSKLRKKKKQIVFK